ncbi:MAG: HAD family hydrolase [Methanobacteriota archaeon]|nr:MAG: HAD family hydrolase [Euryarchaeota archaeon]
MNHAAADARGASMRTSKSQLTIRVSGTGFHSDTYKGSQINTAPDISFGWVAGEAVEVDSVTTRPFVFFDLGGTLVDLRGIVTSMASRLQAIHVRGPIPLALLWATKTAARLPAATGPKFRSEREIATNVLAELLRDRNREKALEEATRLVREAWDGYVQRCALHPDVSVAWLRALRSKVAGLGIVTDGDTEAVAGVLAHTNLKGAFDSITISEEVRTYKPDPRMYRTAMESLGSKPAESLFVSDAALDLQGAIQVGMHAAWIQRTSLGELAKPPAGSLVLARLEDLERIVKRYARSGRFELR